MKRRAPIAKQEEEEKNKTALSNRRAEFAADALQLAQNSVLPPEYLLQASVDDHAMILSRVSSNKQRASLMTQLQQSHGNTYLQTVLNRAGAITEGRGRTVPPSGRNDFRVTTLSDGVRISLGLSALLDGATISSKAEDEEVQTTETEEEIMKFGIGTIEDAILPATIDLTQKALKGGTKLPPDCFGICEPHLKRKCRARALDGKYDVTVQAKIDYRWDVQNLERKNIADANSAEVTRGTWLQVYSDLTPSEQPIPRSPRVKYWCEDLTARHEKYHATDFTTAFSVYRPMALAWLLTQNASSANDACNKGQEAVNRMVTFVNTYMGSGDSAPAEARAYHDGVSHYRARAQAVDARARTQGWDKIE